MNCHEGAINQANIDRKESFWEQLTRDQVERHNRLVLMGGDFWSYMLLIDESMHKWREVHPWREWYFAIKRICEDNLSIEQP